MKLISCTFATFLVMSLHEPLAEGRELHEGLLVKRDWSKVAQQFNLGKHLMTPTAQDHHDGIENSRRLARNAIRLGIDNETHRKLVPDYPPDKIIQYFETATPLPREGPRVDVDRTIDALPFGDGPGVFPGFPNGTKEFWEGTSGPTKIWEVAACPVTDVKGFLENPLRCVLGGDDGSLLDFFSIINGQAIQDAMSNAIVPLAVEFVYNFSGLKWLEEMLSFVCDVLGTLDDIVGVVKSLGDFGESVVDAVNPLNWFRGRKLSELTEEYSGCTNHLTTCSIGNDSTCSACLLNAGQVCDGCRTCFQPHAKAVSDMEGICVTTEQLRDFILAPAPPLFRLQTFYTAIMANYVKKVSSVEILEAILTATENINFSVDEAETNIIGNTNTAKNDINVHTTSAKNDINSHTTSAKNDINSHTTSAKNEIFTKIENTCPAPSSRRLGEALGPSAPLNSVSQEEKQQSFEDFMQSKQAESAKRYASKKGLKDDDVDKIFSKFHSAFSGETGDSFNSKLEEQIKKSLNDPGKMDFIENMINADVEANADVYAGKLATKILEGVTDKQTRRLDFDALRETQSKLKDIRDANIFERRKLSLEGNCLGLIASIKGFIKTEILTPALEGLVTNLVGVFGDDDASSAFEQVQGNNIYQAAIGAVPDVGTSPLLMAFGFVGAFDPWSKGGALQLVMGAIVEIFQTIAGFFIFDCDVFDENDTSCGDLPSVRNKVLPIKERRGDETIYMASGCDSEFEGELFLYAPVLAILEKLLGAAGDAVIEFMNVSIKIIQFLIQAVSLLFGHMDNVCSYLDGYVGAALVEATYENSRYALRELACRNPDSITFQRGYGCDGLDNKQIDECEEDIFPPEINAAQQQTEIAYKRV